MASFGEHLKAATAKEIVRTVRWMIIGIILLGSVTYFYQDIKRTALAVFVHPFTATAQKAQEVKDAVVEKSGELAAGAKEAIVDNAGAVAGAVRDKAPAIIDKAQEKAAEGLQKAKEAGGGLKTKFDTWRKERQKEEKELR